VATQLQLINIIIIIIIKSFVLLGSQTIIFLAFGLWPNARKIVLIEHPRLLFNLRMKSTSF